MPKLTWRPLVGIQARNGSQSAAEIPAHIRGIPARTERRTLDKRRNWGRIIRSPLQVNMFSPRRAQLLSACPGQQGHDYVSMHSVRGRLGDHIVSLLGGHGFR